MSASTPVATTTVVQTAPTPPANPPATPAISCWEGAVNRVATHYGKYLSKCIEDNLKVEVRGPDSGWLDLAKSVGKLALTILSLIPLGIPSLFIAGLTWLKDVCCTSASAATQQQGPPGSTANATTSGATANAAATGSTADAPGTTANAAVTGSTADAPGATANQVPAN